MRNKTRFFNSQGSSSILVLLIAVVVIASLFLVNGIFTETNKPPLDLTAYAPVLQNFTDKRVVLQLKTINFGSCGESAVITFLVDQSGSMRFGTKESNLKNALNVFTTNYPQNGIIGLRTFSDTYYYYDPYSPLPPSYTPLIVPIDYYKNNRIQFANAVSSMTPYRATYTKDAFNLEKADLDAARVKFPKTKFNLVFISDGVPETREANNNCTNNGGPAYFPQYCTKSPIDPLPACRCFDPNQDPTSVATQLKASGVRIFTIAYIYDETEKKFRDDLTALMKNVASDPVNDFYFAPIDNQLTKILDGIKTKICKTQP